ncbi:MAG: hypothetical protein ACI90A_000364 [Shewanella sp.]|jgi:hypothetical protein
MNKLLLSTLISTCLISSAAAASAPSCLGDMYGINNKGSAKIFKLNSTLTSVEEHSDALATSAALAYSPNDNRLYYVTRAIYGKGRLIYVDLETKVHTVVGETQHVYRLAFSPDGNTLYGSKGRSLYTFDTQTAEASLLGRLTGFPHHVDTKMGDIAFVGDDLHLISKKRIFKIDLNTLEVNLVAKHKIKHVNGAEFGGENKLILAKAMGSRSKIFEFDLVTKKKRYLSTVRGRINDLALDTSSCTAPGEIVVDELTADKTQVDEGDFVDYTVSLTGPTEEARGLNLSFVQNGTQVKVDHSSLVSVSFDGGLTWPSVIDINTTARLELPVGTSSVMLRVLTLVDGRDPGEEMELQAWLKEDQDDLASSVVPLIDRANDPTLDGQYISAMVTDDPEILEGEYTSTKIQLVRETDRSTPMHIQFINQSAKKAEDINQIVQISYSNGVTDFQYDIDLLDFKVLHLPAGVSELTVSYQALEDDIVDCSENFSFAAWIVGSGVDYFKHEITIIDEASQCTPAPGEVEFTLTAVTDTVEEGNYAAFVVTLDEALAADATLIVSATAGTADSEDYDLTTYELMIPAGNLTADIDILTIDDADFEATETFTLNVAADTNTLGSHSLPVYITDNDPEPAAEFSVEAVVATVTEGQPAQFTINLSNSLTTDATVNVSAVAGSAGNSDYSFTNEAYTIYAGQTSVTVNVPTVNDNQYEGTETFSFNVTAGTNTTGSTSNTVTINDNDPAPQCMRVSGNGLYFAPGLNVRVDHVRHALDNQRFIFKKNGSNQTGWVYPVNNQWRHLTNVSGGSTYTVDYQYDKSNNGRWANNACRAVIKSAGHGEIQCDDVSWPSWDDTIIKFTYSGNSSCSN